MKKDFIIEPKVGAGVIYNRVVDFPTLRGEFHHHDVDVGPTLTYRQIRLSMRHGPDDDQLTTIMIRPDTPSGVLSFDVNQLLGNTLGFTLHGIHATNDAGGFVLKGSNDNGPFELAINTNPENMNFRPMPCLLVTEVRMPFEEADFARS